MRGIEGRPGSGDVGCHGIQRALWQDFEAFQAIPAVPLHEQQQVICLGRAVHTGPHDAAIYQGRNRVQDGLGDDTNRPLCANQQLFQIIAAIVFFQRCHCVVDGSIGQDRLKAGHEHPHGAVTEYLRSASIG